MKRTLVATVLLVVACAPAGAPKSGPAPVDTRHCADVVAQAFASPTQPVAGVMLCLDSTMTDTANQSGIYDDSDFMHQVAAMPPVYNSEKYCGIAHNGDRVYELSAEDGTGVRLALSVNRTSGLVSGINTTDGAACPQGLR